MQIGEVILWRRTFTEEDIHAFARLSGDEGEQHLLPDENGRLMAHGLLTATLPTKIGGDMNYIARQMTFEFHRPVFAGDTIECEVTLLELEPGDRYTQMAAQFVCRNQSGKEVMTGQTRGVIRNT
jgi:3-hydroxybutyryl-CoA dehydratase